MIVADKQKIRCAIYTRKSSEEGLDQNFNSLDAQRESGEAYISSQQHEGWVCVPHRYDDGGYTGANMERPALQNLLHDIEAGLIDCIVVYKVDRISRSLMDFASMVKVFERHKVAFVSVTQHFNTTHSMGRLTLHILLSFAQFERELISERTRDKIAASRRKGKWWGGRPVLGYDVVRNSGSPKLVVNKDEADRVRQIFDLYLEKESLLATVKQLEIRGWRTKQTTTKKGKVVGGKPFHKMSLFNLLTNNIYLGKIRYQDELYEGEHEAIIDQDLWQKVQSQLQVNGPKGNGTRGSAKYPALLRGLLRCTHCGCAMSPAYTTKRNRRYRYYVCTRAQKCGWHTCPSKSVPAHAIESFVVDQIKCMCADNDLLSETLAQTRRQRDTRLEQLCQDQGELKHELSHCNAELQRLTTAPEYGQDVTARMADLQDRIRVIESRLAKIEEEQADLQQGPIDKDEMVEAFREFEPMWKTLGLEEQARILQLLIERIRYNGAPGNESVSITYRPSGIRTLAEQGASSQNGVTK